MIAPAAVVLVGAVAFQLLQGRAWRLRREAGSPEDVTPPMLRVLTIALVVGCFALRATDSAWAPSRNVALGVCFASLALGQGAMWARTLRHGYPRAAAALESGAMIAVIVAAYVAWLLL